MKSKMLVFHSAYTFADIKDRGLEVFISARDAGAFFQSVLTVSPIASLQYPSPSASKYGKPQYFQMNSRNLIVEGRVARFAFLKTFKKLNFVLAQISLMSSLFFRKEFQGVSLVRSEDPRLNGLYGLVFSRILRKPLVVGVWGNPSRIRESTQQPLMPNLFPSCTIEEKFEKFVLLRADMVIAQNLENLNYALKLGVKVSRTQLMPLGVGIDSNHFLDKSLRLDLTSEFSRFGIGNNKIVVCISRLEKLKNVEHALLICAELKKYFQNFKLILVGDGKEKNSLVELTHALAITQEVIFAGNRNQEWLAGLLACADLALAPLTGRALLEIGLAGCPAVAYDIDWHSEIVQNNISGFLVENLDYISAAKAASRILSSPSLRDELGQNMKSLAISMANSHNLARAQFTIYRNLIKNGNT